MAAQPSPGRSSTLSNIAWLTAKLDESVSGVPSLNRARVSPSQWA